MATEEKGQTGQTTQAPEEAKVVSEEDLLKSLEKLEKPKEEEKKPPEPQVKIEGLTKTASDTLKDDGSEELKKALADSKLLPEIVQGFGKYLDTSLEALQKSIQSSAERDLKFIKLFEQQNERIDELKKALDAFGNQPARAPKTDMGGEDLPGKTAMVEVLTKTADKEDGQGISGSESADEIQKSALKRQQVSAVFEELAKSADRNSVEQQRWITAAVKFETTGEIDDADLAQVHLKLKKAA